MAEKEGLLSAIDFTKYLLTLAGGAIAFVIQPTFYSNNGFIKVLSVAALILLTICVISGLAIFSRGSVMLSEKTYSLSDPRIRGWGIINIVSFGLAFIILAIAIGVGIFSKH